ncbi:MAG: metalloregulator ArsR/SmtB family transcription factor [Cloacibacillus sp.]
MADYMKLSERLKALSDPNRLMIVEMLSGGELCACKLLERFKITQPTLSHHMKTLCHAGLVTPHKEGKWMHYELNIEAFRGLELELRGLTCAQAQQQASGRVSA